MSFQSTWMNTILIIACFSGPLVAIRVDWNTNHGPIVPPTSTVAPVPQPPFREPAPVWEDQSDDVPNYNPYKYVAPPPSRPRYNNPDDQLNNVAKSKSPSPTTSTTSTSTSTTTTTSVATPVNYGTIVRPNQVQKPEQTKTVASLSPQYIPNVGKKYFAVVPSSTSWTNPKTAYIDENNVYDKINGKYNAKLKKYKAYEQKAKMVPYVVYSAPSQQYIYYSNYPAKSFQYTKQPQPNQWTYNRL